jgi:hypothetical protein
MGHYKSDDIGKGHTVVPSHRPMPGVDDKPIDLGVPERERSPHDKQKRERQPEPGISPSTHPDHLF